MRDTAQGSGAHGQAGSPGQNRAEGRVDTAGDLKGNGRGAEGVSCDPSVGSAQGPECQRGDPAVKQVQGAPGFTFPGGLHPTAAQLVACLLLLRLC